MQGQVGRLEEGMARGQADHMTVMQTFLNRQIIPVKNRIAGPNIAEAANARACRFKPGDNIAELPTLMQ